MDCLPDRTYVTYPSQVTYTDGCTMCTSVCYMLGCGLISGYNIGVPPSREQMETVMQVASIVHRKLRRNSQYEQHLFSVMDVQGVIGLPDGISSEEVMGSVGPLPEGFIVSYEDSEDNPCTITDMKSFIHNLQDQSVALLTVHDHTTAIYRRDMDHWYFDPMVASFSYFRDSDTLVRNLSCKIPPSAGTFTGVVFRLKPPSPPHPGRGASS